MRIRRIVAIFLGLVFLTTSALAQTTAFNFQGRLNDGLSPANGRYDLQFKLFDSITGGSQVGSTIDRGNLLLINGVFSTALDFGPTAFGAGNRFLEISVRPFNSPNAHVVLGARQQILSVPLAVRATSAVNADTAINATNAANAANATTAQNSLALGGTSASEYARLDANNSGSLIANGLASTGVLGVTGNAFQLHPSFGLPKALIYTKIDPKTANLITRCYNGTTNTSAGDCGFSVTYVPSTDGGIWRINLNFPVTDRFIFLTAEYASFGGHNYGANFKFFNSTTIEVYTFEAGESADTHDAGFMLTIF